MDYLLNVVGALQLTAHRLYLSLVKVNFVRALLKLSFLGPDHVVLISFFQGDGASGVARNDADILLLLLTVLVNELFKLGSETLELSLQLFILALQL